MAILNLTQHAPTKDQMEAGVYSLPQLEGQELKELLTFNFVPTAMEVADRATAIAEMAASAFADAAMIGGAPYLMGPLEAALKDRGIAPLYAFSERRSIEVKNEAGEVTKTAVFVHLGFVEA